MRKRLIYTNSFIVILALIIMLIASSFIMSKQNKENNEKDIYEYLKVSVVLYDGTNADEVSQKLSAINSNIRFTVINLDGTVLFDNGPVEEMDNHLDRPEIKNLGTIYTRYSQTKNNNMLYIAGLDDGSYLRISIPMSSINKSVNSFIIIGTITSAIIMIASICFITIFSNKSLEVVNENASRLAKLAGKDDFEKVTIDDLSQVLYDLTWLFDDKINAISNQKQEVISLLNQINQAVVVIDCDKYVRMINKVASEIFKTNNCVGKEYIYLVRDISLQNAINDAIDKQLSNNLDIEINNKKYSVLIEIVKEEWLNGGIVLTLTDMTKEYNLIQSKKDFFQNASHELKSPLTSIIGYQQMITEGIETDKEEMVEYSKKTLREAVRMNSIINDMLDISSLEQKHEVEYNDVNIESVVEEIVDTLRPISEEKGIEIQLDLEPVIIKSNIRLIDELIRNLIDNAIKYTNKGQIQISLKDNSFTITDSGVGISENDLPRIFERFYRVDKGRSKEQGGTGLGLAIVKHICELYGYEISVTSTLYQGTTFKVIFK